MSSREAFGQAKLFADPLLYWPHSQILLLSNLMLQSHHQNFKFVDQMLL